MRISKARAGLRTGKVCHRRWDAYGKFRRQVPEVRAGCIKVHVRISAGGAGQLASLPRQVDLGVDIRSIQGDMTEPAADGIDINARAEEMGCGGCGERNGGLPASSPAPGCHASPIASAMSKKSLAGICGWARPVPRQHSWIGEQIFKHRRISLSAGKSDQYRKIGQVMWRSKVSSRRWKAPKERDAT